MKERVRRYIQHVMVFVFTFVFLAGSIFSFSFETKASSLEFEVSYAEPATSDAQGYISVLFQNNEDGRFMVWTYFWYCVAEKNGVSSPCYAVIDLEPSKLTFSVGGVGSATSAYYNLNLIDGVGQYGSIKVSATSSYTRSFDGWTIYGYKYAGNVGELNRSCARNDFTLLYSADASAVLLQDIFNVLNESASLDADLYNVVYDIYNSVDSVEGKLDSVVTYLKSVDSKLSSISTQLSSIYSRAGEILAEEKAQTTWLEKIWNSIQEFLTGEPSDDASPPVDEDNVLGSIEESEEVLLPDTSDAEASLDFEFNSGFGLLTWLVERFAQFDPGVFSMYLSMLTFGVIALLLGR